jgi:hypothetical protein
MSLSVVQRQFEEMAGFPLQPRRANRLDMRMDRQDTLFSKISELAYEAPHRLERLARVCPQWLERADCETTRALAGCIFYCRGDYGRAARHWMAAIAAEPSNLDTWLDLAFALTHDGQADLGRHILFNYDEYVKRFKGPVLSLAKLRALREAIESEGCGYAQRWTEYVPDAARFIP